MEFMKAKSQNKDPSLLLVHVKELNLYQDERLEVFDFKFKFSQQFVGGFVNFFFFLATPIAHGSSPVRDQTWATAATQATAMTRPDP